MNVTRFGFLAVLAFILPCAYAQSGGGLDDSFIIYDNNASNAELTISMDKFIYSPGEHAKIAGYITVDYREGQKLLLQLTDSYGTLHVDLAISPTKDGIFTVDMTMPKTKTTGTFSLSAKYGPNGTPITLTTSVEVFSTETIVSIPKRAQFQESELNFEPDLVIVEQGLPIKWINNDDVVHTVVSIERNFLNKIIETGLFSSGTFAKNNPFVLTLYDVGDYTYYCKLHPWLVGQISVVKSTDPKYSPPKPNDETPENPFLNDDYIKIKLNKKIYFADEIVRISGSVQEREGSQPLTFQVINSKQNIVSVNQLMPKNKAFSFILPLSGNQFNQGGEYKLAVQYGVQQHRTEIYFTLEKPSLVQQNYKGYDIYGGQQYYAVSYGSGSLDDVLFSNLVKNPSFEYDLDGSKVLNWSPPKKPFTGQLDSTTVYDGRYSYKISTKSSDEKSSSVTSDAIPAKAGQVYYAEVYARATNAKDLEIRVETFHNKTWVLIADLNTKKDDTTFSWIKFAKEIIIPKSSRDIRLVLNAGDPADPKKTANTWFDDITIRLSKKDKDVLLITSGSIENLMKKIDKAPPVGPILVEENYKDYGLIMYAGSFYGVLGDYKKADYKNMNSTTPSAKSIDDLKKTIDNVIKKQKAEAEKEEKPITEKPMEGIGDETVSAPQVEPDEMIPTLQLVVTVAVILVGIYFGLRYFKRKNT